MSDKGIIIKVDEKRILVIMNSMCEESMPPDLFAAWEEVRDALIDTRTNLIGYCDNEHEHEGEDNEHFM